MAQVELPIERPFMVEGSPPAEPRDKSDAEVALEIGEASIPTEHGVRRWLIPLVDLVCGFVALGLVDGVESSHHRVDLIALPLLMLAFSGAIGAYEDRTWRRGPGVSGRRTRELGLRALVGVFLAWGASLLVPLSIGDQLLLWACYFVFDTVGRMIGAEVIARTSRIERWILVGSESTAARLVGYQPLSRHAKIVCAVLPPHEDGMEGVGYRRGAIEVVDRYKPDRAVIASHLESDQGLLALVRAFQAVGVPVSLLPRPLDLVEAPAATPNRIGGVPLIEVEALSVREVTPYAGPDRREGARRAKVSVVVPAMNEEQNIGPVLGELPEGLHQVILVDGNSKDETVAAARRAYPGIDVVTQTGKGKGDALRAGFAAVSGNLIVMLDADGSADPAEIPRFVEALESGADFAKGSRFIAGGGSADITALRKLGNRFLGLTVNTLHRTSFTDLCYGYNAFWTRCLPHISLDVPGFEVETHINLRVASAGMRIIEVPSYERDRFHGQSNLNTFRDGFRVLHTILSEARRNQLIRRSRVSAVSGAEQSEKATA
jgi:Glycosyl transferase family 2